MEVNITFARKHFVELADLIIDEKEKEIIITKYGKPFIKLSKIKHTNRVGIAKDRIPPLSFEEFESIPIEGFYL